MRFSRPLTLALPFLLGITGYIGYEGFLIRQEAAAFRSGRYDDAARLAEPVALMRRTLAEQLRTQLAELESQGAGPDPLPLLEKLHALSPDPALASRLALARLLASPADALAIEGAAMAFPAPGLSRPEAPPEPLFRAEPLPAKQTAWGGWCRLSHQAPDGTWRELGEGFDGPLGASFELAADGQALLVAGDEAIERWDLATGHVETLPTTGSPQFVTAQPQGDRLAYTVAGEAGDALYVWEDGKSRQVYPPADATWLPWLGVQWAPDGASLIAMWEQDQPNAEPASRLAWLSAEGAVLLEATLAVPLADLDPRWQASPDGRRMLLAAGEGAWAWTRGEAAPVVLGDLGDPLGWSPDGQKVAGLDGPELVILDVAAPERQTRATVSGLPAVFEPRAGGFAWTGDRLKVPGRAADQENGPYREAVLTAGLAISPATAPPANR